MTTEKMPDVVRLQMNQGWKSVEEVVCDGTVYYRAEPVEELLKRARDELNDTIPFIGWVPRDPQMIIDKITRTITSIDKFLGEK